VVFARSSQKPIKNSEIVNARQCRVESQQKSNANLVELASRDTFTDSKQKENVSRLYNQVQFFLISWTTNFLNRKIISQKKSGKKMKTSFPRQRFWKSELFTRNIKRLYTSTIKRLFENKRFRYAVLTQRFQIEQGVPKETMLFTSTDTFLIHDFWKQLPRQFSKRF